MKVKLLITLLTFLLIAALPTFAQDDQGDPDSLILVTSVPDAANFDGTFVVELWCWNDVNWVMGVAVGFEWENENLILTSATNSTGWPFSYLYNGTIGNSNTTKKFQFVSTALDTADALRGSTERKLLGTWNFTLTTWDAGDYIFLDTNEYEAGVEYTMESNDGSGSVSYTPVWALGDGGLFVRDPSDADDESEDLLPTTYSLKQNYPNPFNPETGIEFALPTSGAYKLTIFNVLGQVVKTFEDEAEAGWHKVSWDASDNGSGVYFYRLTAGDFTDTKKMVFLK